MVEAFDWIEWSGGECPVPVDVRVDIQIRNSRRSGELLDVRAGDWTWAHGNLAWITAYRIAKVS